MENRGDIKSRCKGVLLRNSGPNSGVRGLGTLGTDSGCTGSVRTVELNSGRTGRTSCSDDVAGVQTPEGASDACVFFAHALWLWAYGFGPSALGFSFYDYWFRRHVSHALQAIHPNTGHYLNLL